MKASWCGTLTEQVMFRQGYLTSKERQAKGIYNTKCGNCKHIQHAIASKSARCNLGNFCVTINATCDKWQA